MHISVCMRGRNNEGGREGLTLALIGRGDQWIPGSRPCRSQILLFVCLTARKAATRKGDGEGAGTMATAAAAWAGEGVDDRVAGATSTPRGLF